MLLDLKSKEYKNWDHRSQWQIEAFERIMKISGRSGHILGQDIVEKEKTLRRFETICTYIDLFT
jgi:hypothetical protein